MISDAIDQVIALSKTPLLIQLLVESPDARLQYEILWVLTNICAGDHRQTTHVVTEGGIPVLLQLATESAHLDVSIQAWWCLGNIAGDSPQLRVLLVEAGMVTALKSFCHRIAWESSMDQHQMQISRILAWLIANLCRGSKSQELWSNVGFVCHCFGLPSAGWWFQ
jgi:hypothetical protein